MVAHMNAEALAKTIATGEAWYFSRSRSELWKKGETSGHTQRVVEMRDRLRSGRGVDQGRAGGRRLPHRAPLVLLSRRAARQERVRSRSSFATSGCSIRRRLTANNPQGLQGGLVLSSLRAQRSNPVRPRSLDWFVASLLAMTGVFERADQKTCGQIFARRDRFRAQDFKRNSGAYRLRGARQQLLGAHEMRPVVHHAADADDAGAGACGKGRR